MSCYDIPTRLLIFLYFIPPYQNSMLSCSTDWLITREKTALKSNVSSKTNSSL